MQTLDLQDGDIYVTAGQLALVYDGDETAQTIKTRLSTFLGEYFLNVNYGIPYFQVLQSQESVEALNISIKSMINGVVGVDKIKDFQTNLNSTTRVYSVSAIINTTYNDDVITINQNYEL